MLEVFTNHYEKLVNLNIKGLCPKLVAARIISHSDNQVIQGTIAHSQVTSLVLENIASSLRTGVTLKFDKFLSMLENDDDLCCNVLANQMRGELSQNTTGTVTIA